MRLCLSRLRESAWVSRGLVDYTDSRPVPEAADKLKVLIAPGVKHQVTADQKQAALEWFEKWLKAP